MLYFSQKIHLLYYALFLLSLHYISHPNSLTPFSFHPTTLTERSKILEPTPSPSRIHFISYQYQKKFTAITFLFHTMGIYWMVSHLFHLSANESFTPNRLQSRFSVRWPMGPSLCLHRGGSNSMAHMGPSLYSTEVQTPNPVFTM